MTPTSDVGVWLHDHLSGLTLGEDTEGYLYGRGATDAILHTLGVKEWVPSTDISPSAVFRQRYGNHGERLKGMIVFPILSPTGMLIGMEARTPSRDPSEKRISEFRLPEASWNPFLINTPQAAEKLWSGGSIWICEGVYDLFALARVIPPKDALVATLKAGLAKSHIQFLSRFCQGQVYMVYDNDETGRQATNGFYDAEKGRYRPGALGLLKKAGLVAVDFRYRGKDPGEVWSSGGQNLLMSTFPIYG